MPTDDRAARRQLPLVAVVYGAPSFGVFDLAQASADTCRLAFLIDGDPRLGRALRRLGPIVDVSGQDDSTAIEAARSISPDAITTFSDGSIPRAAIIAEGLGLPFHSPDLAPALVRKSEQRRALEAAGLDVPRFARISLDGGEPDARLDAFEFPVVVKPDSGAGSRETRLASGPEDVVRALADARAAGVGAAVVEEYLADDPGASGPDTASFVSVESVLVGGAPRHLAVTGKFPLAEPFRETGHFVPARLSGDRAGAVLDAASRAITGIGIRFGSVHTEVKLTPSGPRIIEVNGRTAGAVPGVLAAAGGHSLLRYGLLAALGAVEPGGLLPCPMVGYRINVQPPTWARRVRAVAGLDRLPGAPTVQSVNLLRKDGDAVDWRLGTDEMVVAVVGAVPSMDKLAEARRRVLATISIDYE